MATRSPRSAAATPIRRSPGSIARMRPLVGIALSSCCDILLTGEKLSRYVGHLLQRLGELRGVLTATGGQVRPAAAAAAVPPPPPPPGVRRETPWMLWVPPSPARTGESGGPAARARSSRSTVLRRA